DLESLADRLGLTDDVLKKIITYSLPALFCYVFVDRPARFGLCVGAYLMAGGIYADLKNEQLLHRERSFFGVMKVQVSDGYIELIHGTTLHGKQSLDPSRRGEAVTYFHRTGPIGQVFEELKRRGKAPPLALIGLGTGTLASYTQPGQSATYYEIDRA